MVTFLGKVCSRWTLKGPGRAQGVWSKFVSATGTPLGLGAQSQAAPNSPSRSHLLFPSFHPQTQGQVLLHKLVRRETAGLDRILISQSRVVNLLHSSPSGSWLKR